MKDKERIRVDTLPFWSAADFFAVTDYSSPSFSSL